MSVTHTYFVSGTDTGVGKTFATAALLEAAKNNGYRCFGLKPVAAGSEVDEALGRVNEDAVTIMQHASVDLSYQEVNPVLLDAPIAPHIAAGHESRHLSVDRIAGFCRGSLVRHKADLVLIEGAGGWYVPLNSRENMSHLVKVLNLPVVLVVGMRLGCLNHALLTVEAIQKNGFTLAGWIANTLDETMPSLEENIRSLKNLIAAPCLGVLPCCNESRLEESTSEKNLHDPSIQQASKYLDLSTLVANAEEKKS